MKGTSGLQNDLMLCRVHFTVGAVRQRGKIKAETSELPWERRQAAVNYHQVCISQNLSPSDPGATTTHTSSDSSSELILFRTTIISITY